MISKVGSLLEGNKFVGISVGNLIARVDFVCVGDFLGEFGPIFDVFRSVTAESEIGEDFGMLLALDSEGREFVE